MNILLESFIDRNLGDDLMLSLLVHRYPGVNFMAVRDVALNGREPYCGWPNFLVPDWGDLDSLLPLVDGFIVYGGSAWQDHGDNHHWFAWRRKVVEAMRRRGKFCLAIGNNIGPLKTEEGRQLFAGLACDFDHLTVRDRFSFQWLRDAGAGDKVTLCADICFNLATPAPARDPGLVGISVHRSALYPERNAAYAEAVAAMVEGLHARQPELRIELFGFDSISERDDFLIDQIYHRLGRPAFVTCRTYVGDLDGFLAAFGRCAHVFASRFHALLLALLWDIPFTPFDYMGKTAALLADLDYRGPVFTHEDFPERVGEAVANMLTSPMAFDPAALAAMRSRAVGNFDCLDARLDKEDKQASKRMILGLLPSAARA